MEYINEILDLVWDVLESEDDGVCEIQYLLNGLVDELKKDSKGVLNAVQNKIKDVQAWCIKNDVCPDCGTMLEFEHDSDYDTYVPYGDTTVLESEGGFFTCPNCGFRKEN